jgi:pSer/pThr/pTyr-binding forkhead associated (FHA) protein
MTAFPDEPEAGAARPEGAADEPEAEAGQPSAGEEPEAPQEAGDAPALGSRLVLKRANRETEEVFPFAPPVVIGRFAPDAGPVDVDLGTIPEGAYVSRRHARIDLEDGVYTVTDLGSSNGTFLLRGEFTRVESAPLADGDEVAFGNARFVFRTG